MARYFAFFGAIAVIAFWLFPPLYECRVDGCYTHEYVWRFSNYARSPVDTGRLLLNFGLVAAILALGWLFSLGKR